MNKKYILPIIIILALAGFGIYKLVGASKNKINDTKKETESTIAKSLKDLLASGNSQKCTYDQGVVYITNGKVRGDFDVSTSENVTKSHMIVDGKTSYVWTDGSKTGIKMSFDTASATPSSGTEEKGGIDPVKPMNYVCNAWIVDSSMFTLPTGVNFTDVSSLISPSVAPSGTNNSVDSKCSYCDALSGDAKAQCLSAMNCE